MSLRTEVMTLLCGKPPNMRHHRLFHVLALPGKVGSFSGKTMGQVGRDFALGKIAGSSGCNAAQVCCLGLVDVARQTEMGNGHAKSVLRGPSFGVEFLR
jgi:hypothetical protein